MKEVPVLYTARLTLRGIVEEDTHVIVALRSDPNVYKFFVSPHQITEEEHLTWYKHSYLSNGNRIDWITFDTASNLVGVFGVKREDENSAEAEVSYILSPEQYGKGYASEAVKRLIQFCRDEWKCKYVTAEVHKDNNDSIRFAEKLGFIQIRSNGLFFHFRRKS